MNDLAPAVVMTIALIVVVWAAVSELASVLS